jgi:hypothetical protein
MADMHSRDLTAVKQLLHRINLVVGEEPDAGPSVVLIRLIMRVLPARGCLKRPDLLSLVGVVRVRSFEIGTSFAIQCLSGLTPRV